MNCKGTDEQGETERLGFSDFDEETRVKAEAINGHFSHARSTQICGIWAEKKPPIILLFNEAYKFLMFLRQPRSSYSPNPFSDPKTWNV